MNPVKRLAPFLFVVWRAGPLESSLAQSKETLQPKLELIFSPECPVCRNHVKDVKALREEFPDLPITLIFPSEYFSEGEVDSFMVRYGLDVGWKIEKENTRIRELDAEVMPTSYVFGPDGELVYSGKLNDRPVRLGKVRPVAANRYVRDAIIALKTGKEPVINRTDL